MVHAQAGDAEWLPEVAALVAYRGSGSESEEPVPVGVAALFVIGMLAVCQGSGVPAELAQAEAAESGVPLVCQGSGAEEPVPAGLW